MSSIIDPPLSPAATLRQLAAGTIPRPRRRPLYTLSLWLVALLCCLIPALYLALVAGLAWTGVHYYLAWAPRSGFILWRVIAWTVPGFVIGVLLLFLVKPLFAPRTRAPAGVGLAPEEESDFIAAVHALCKAIGIRPPRRILLSHQANAWVAFSPGPAGILGGARVLTLGLPLVAGMNCSQLVGVLAHEFGHFAQRGGMRAAYLIHHVNHWLESRAYHPDAWDERLQRWREDEEGSGLMQLASTITLWCLQLTRLMLRGLFQVSFRMSQRLSQQMEFDADRYEAILAGSAAFADTSLRLRALARAVHQVDQLNRKAWREGRLADDLPDCAAQRLAQWRPEDWQWIQAQMQSNDQTRYWDSHPADQARIASAQALAEAGLFHDPRPAAQLFDNFPALCRRVTDHYYRALDLDFGPRNLIDSAQLLGLGRLPQALAETWTHYTNDLLGLVPLMDPADMHRLPAAAFDWQGSVDELRRLGPDASGLWQRLDRLRARADRLSLWIALLDMQVDFVMPDGSEPDGIALRTEYAACSAQDTPDRKLAERLLGLFARRLHHAVATLEGEPRRQADARLALLQHLHGQWPGLHRLARAGRVCLRLHDGMPADDDHLRQRIYALGEQHRQDLTRLLASMDGIALPDGMTLGRYLRSRCGRLSSAGADPFAFIQVTAPLEDLLLQCYQLHLAELMAVATAAEHRHGIRPIRLFAARPRTP